jgi:uncharacterized membrane protein YkvA (DUF1232 family)
MTRWLLAIAILLLAWIGLWLLTLLLTRLLPEGAARSAINLLPSTLTLFHRLIRSNAIPRRARLVLVIGFAYAVSPITLIPDFIPIVGKLDNFLALYLSIRWAARRVPLSVLLDAWPGTPAQLTLLIGRRSR